MRHCATFRTQKLLLREVGKSLIEKKKFEKKKLENFLRRVEVSINQKKIIWKKKGPTSVQEDFYVHVYRLFFSMQMWGRGGVFPVHMQRGVHV